MIGQCPRCELRLELPASGAYQCQRCRQTFQVFLADPAAVRDRPHSFISDAPPTIHDLSPLAPAAAQGQCAAHPTNPATDTCERCGDFMCAVCRTHVEGRYYCPRCFDLLYNRGALQFTQMAFRLPGYALGLGILSTASLACLGCYGLLSLPAGIIAVILGVASLREIARRPDLPGRQQAIGGIVCGALGALITVGAWTWFAIMLYTQMRRGG